MRVFFLGLLLLLGPTLAEARELPLAAESPLAGVAFVDRPVALPSTHNFQIALQSASRDLNRQCGLTEAYGWQLSASEQSRVNSIFAATTERLKSIGFTLTPQAPQSLSRDLTVFTAARRDRGRDRELMFVWSAGDLGLALLVCDLQPMAQPTPSQSVASKANQPNGGLRLTPDFSPATVPLPEAKQPDPFAKFSPKGRWIGNYTCAQGITGVTLTIDKLDGEQIGGTFRFYPTPRNPSVPRGAYRIAGTYDRETKRILIEPGAWLERPENFYEATIVGRFDPARQTFSGFYQGIAGCTSIEATLAGRENASASEPPATKPKPKAKKPKSKPAAAKPAAATKPPAPAASEAVHSTTTGATPDNATAPAAVEAVPAITPEAVAAPEPSAPAVAPATPTPVAAEPAAPALMPDASPTAAPLAPPAEIPAPPVSPVSNPTAPAATPAAPPAAPTSEAAPPASNLTDALTDPAVNPAPVAVPNAEAKPTTELDGPAGITMPNP